MSFSIGELATVAVGSGASLFAGALVAQAPALQRTIVQKTDVSVPDKLVDVYLIEKLKPLASPASAPAQ